MQIIAVETSGRTGSIAALRGDRAGLQVVGQSTLAKQERTAMALAPALRSLLAEIGWRPATIELVAVNVGPGSFTGLRIGVTTAKTLAYAVSAEVVGVNTMAVIAEQTTGDNSPLWTVMDAQRGELFAAKFEASANGVPRMTGETTIMSIDALLGVLRTGDRVSGPGLQRIALRLPPGVAAVDSALWQPTAAAVGSVAWRAYYAGQRDDCWKLVPQYYRLSAAEEKAVGKRQSTGA